MKLLLLLTPLLLVACAPRAILLREAKATAPRDNQKEQSVASTPTPDSGNLPQRSGDNLGLLEPGNLTQIPDEREMRPTVDPDDKPPVIGTPPVNE